VGKARTQIVFGNMLLMRQNEEEEEEEGDRLLEKIA
jgi:hypothetical protein